MFEGDPDTRQRAFTGTLPADAYIDATLTEIHERYRRLDDGEVADYIPILAEADPAWFGLSLIDNTGLVHEVGDVETAFSIQSISKAFVFALVCQARSHELVHERIGVNNTGLPFNSVMAIELNDGKPMNSMVNAGAIATTALMTGESPAEKWEAIRTGLSEFAGRSLELDGRVYRSEMKTNQRNKALARLLESYGRIITDPLDTVDIYTRQCSLSVTAHDLAVMGATLADGGVNPLTGTRVVSAEVARDTLALLASCGMYENSGEWLFEIGLPAKSGVSGGIVAIAPGKGALGTFSPRLDSAGNSVRGQRACFHLSRSLGMNLFASVPTTGQAQTTRQRRTTSANPSPAPRPTPAPDPRPAPNHRRDSR
ncbi:MAG: glutaminase A [Brevibacterium sp.]